LANPQPFSFPPKLEDPAVWPGAGWNPFCHAVWLVGWQESLLPVSCLGDLLLAGCGESLPETAASPFPSWTVSTRPALPDVATKLTVSTGSNYPNLLGLADSYPLQVVGACAGRSSQTRPLSGSGWVGSELFQTFQHVLKALSCEPFHPGAIVEDFHGDPASIAYLA